MINSGIGSTTAKSSLTRIERDVLSHHPDAVIVCFGLNDINFPKEEYIGALRSIFQRLEESAAQVIFMTPNTYVADDTPVQHINYARVTADFQNNGKMDEYIFSAISVANEMNVTVCDCYSEWKKLYKSGIDTTKLLINRINHPDRRMHQLFADMLFDLIIDTKDNITADYADTIFKK